MRLKRIQSGVTLAEMMVAVALMVVIFGITGMVFKSTTTAAGKSTSSADISRQVRGLTTQLKQDLAGLRPDMPFVVLFENDQYGYSQDRIVFFANGRFKTTNGLYSGQMARIFYGHSHESDAIPSVNSYSNIIPVRHLIRRSKILSYDIDQAVAAFTLGGYQGLCGPISYVPWSGSSLGASVDYDDNKLPDPIKKYDSIPIENPYYLTTLSTFTSLYQYFKSLQFNTYSNILLQDNLNISASWIRRTQIAGMSPDEFQPVYLLGDVGSFKIQLWFEGADRWFPDPILANTVHFDTSFNRFLHNGKAGWESGGQFGFAWNIPDLIGDLSANKSETFIQGSYYDKTTTPPTEVALPVNWRTPMGISKIKDYYNKNFNWSGMNIWPRAIKITFIVFDENRSQYPDGVTNSIILPLPQP